jgi:DNA-binding transcriptional LysR family regulator
MKTTLDGWEILQALVHLGGFTPAAEKLHRSQSTISYAIERLEEQLGIELFELRGRKACLTEAGRALLAEAEPYLMGFRQIEHRAQSLAAGEQLDIRLSVDSLFPNDRLFAALAELVRRFPHVRPNLRQCTFLSADAEFSAHNAQLCVSGITTSECFLQPVMDIRMQAVARRSHPLALLEHQPTRIDMMQHTLVIIEGAGPGRKFHQPRSPLQRSFMVGTVDAALAAISAGIGFGWLPIYRIQQEIEHGELVPLQLPVGGVREVRLSLVWKDTGSTHSELSALAELLGRDREVDVI